MYKYLLSVSFVILSAQVVAGNATNIKAAEVTSPVHAGIFRGFCDNLNLANLKTPADFASLGTTACQYMTDQTLDPKKPNAVLKAWHQGAGSLKLVAFQDNGAPVQCVIDDAYKTMFVLGGPDGLKCTSPQETGAAQEEEVAVAAPAPKAIAAEAPAAVIPVDAVAEDDMAVE